MRDVAFVALGSNLGDRFTVLADARSAIAALPGSKIIGESSIEETEAIGPISQPPFLNQMVALETTLEPHTLLDHLLAIEVKAGRVRGVRWGPRTLDLDIVQFEVQRVDDPDLRVPHPELPHRPFWQRELAELAGVVAGGTM